MSYLDEFKRMTGQTELPGLDEAEMLVEQRLYENQFGTLLEALEEVAAEEGATEDEVRTAFEMVFTDDEAADELSELLRQSSGGGGAALRGGSIGSDPTKARYAKAFGPKAVARAEKRAEKKLAAAELKKIRSAAAAKAWKTRKKGQFGKKVASAFGKVKSFAKKMLGKAKKMFGGKKKLRRARA